VQGIKPRFLISIWNKNESHLSSRTPHRIIHITIHLLSVSNPKSSLLLGIDPESTLQESPVQISVSVCFLENPNQSRCLWLPVIEIEKSFAESVV
jgi:hypothetical protein